MPSMYRNITTGLWTSHKYFRDLSPMERYIYIYLLSCTFTSELSLFPLPIDLQPAILKLEIDKFMDAFRKLESKGIIFYDEEHEEVLVAHYFDNHTPNAGITYEMYRNDLMEIKSEKLVDRLVEIAKNYKISLAFYAALADRRPFLESAEVMSGYSFKDKEPKPLHEIRTLARKGRENR